MRGATTKQRPLLYGKRYRTKLREIIRVDEFVTTEDGGEKVSYSFLTGPQQGRSFESDEPSLQKRIKGTWIK